MANVLNFEIEMSSMGDFGILHVMSLVFYFGT